MHSSGFRGKLGGLESLETRRCLAASSAGWDGPGLGSAQLTYYIGSIPSTLDETEVTQTLVAALEVWSSVADLAFNVTSRANLRDSIDFTFGEIDGPRGTLAQAYLPDDVNPPRLAGNIQFDVDEAWEIGNARRFRATDLMLVAVHEIGHALGLGHSTDPQSVMIDAVSPNQQYRSLAQSDIDAILSLYAPAPVPSTEPEVGDFNADGFIDLQDVTLMEQSIRSGKFLTEFDLNQDGLVDLHDQGQLIKDLLGTTRGDANLDGVFDMRDVVHVLQAAEFDDQVSGNSTWATGDWNSDGEFDSLDIVLALQDGGWREVAI